MNFDGLTDVVIGGTRFWHPSGRWTDGDASTNQKADNKNWKSSWEQYRKCGEDEQGEDQECSGD